MVWDMSFKINEFVLLNVSKQMKLCNLAIRVGCPHSFGLFEVFDNMSMLAYRFTFP